MNYASNPGSCAGEAHRPTTRDCIGFTIVPLVRVALTSGITHRGRSVDYIGDVQTGGNVKRKSLTRLSISTISRSIATRNVTTDRRPVTRPKLDAAASIPFPSHSKITQACKSNVLSATRSESTPNRRAGLEFQKRRCGPRLSH